MPVADSKRKTPRSPAPLELDTQSDVVPRLCHSIIAPLLRKPASSHQLLIWQENEDPKQLFRVSTHPHRSSSFIPALVFPKPQSEQGPGLEAHKQGLFFHTLKPSNKKRESLKPPSPFQQPGRVPTEYILVVLSSPDFLQRAFSPLNHFTVRCFFAGILCQSPVPWVLHCERHSTTSSS